MTRWRSEIDLTQQQTPNDDDGDAINNVLVIETVTVTAAQFIIETRLANE